MAAARIHAQTVVDLSQAHRLRSDSTDQDEYRMAQLAEEEVVVVAEEMEWQQLLAAGY